MSVNNDKALKFYKEMSINNPDKFSTKNLKLNDHSDIDAEFLSKYLTPGTDLLDIGSGTGLLIEKIYKIPRSITCVEPFEEFSKFILMDKRINVITSNINYFETNDKFDIISLFGVINYFSSEETLALYKKLYFFLKSDGIIIIKNQFGLNSDVEISGLSKELNKEYFADYRLLTHELQLLWSVGFNKTNVFDIYPPEFNRWENTHYFAITAKKI